MGFRSHHNVETALVEISNDLVSDADSVLLSILFIIQIGVYCNYGYGPDLVWSYLTGRTQFVQLKQFTSTPTTEVPQGSVLGPLSFTSFGMTPNSTCPPNPPLLLILSECVAKIKDWFTSF